MRSKELSVFGDILKLLRGINIPPAYLLIPIGLSLVAALFEGASIGLLIPLLNGFLQKDFSFVTNAPVIGPFLQTVIPPSLLNGDRVLFIALIAIFVFAVIIKNILKYLSVLTMTYFSERALHHLRKVLFGRYLAFGKLYFDLSNVGHHATVLSEFSQHALWPIQRITKHVNALFSLIVYFVVMSTISWQLTLFALPLFALLHFSVRKLIERMRTLSRSIADQGSELGKKSIEILSTIPLVKSYGTETRERDAYGAISDTKARLDFRVRAMQEFILPFQETVTLVSASILFSGMVYLLMRDPSSAASSMLVYFYLVVNASSKFGTLMGFRGTLASVKGPVDELLTVFDDAGKHIIPDGDGEFPGIRKDIRIEHLTFSFPGRDSVLNDVSFTIPRGKMTAIVGPTGSGKTTLISLLMRYYDSPPGTIMIDAQDIRSFRLHSLVRHIALVSQETLLLHDSLRSNIAYGLSDVSEQSLREAVDRARLADFVADLPQGLETLIGDRGVKLSGGEKQRVSIARALLKGSEILILDEATSSLDSRTEKLIQEAIDEAVKDRTAIVIAHRLSTIQHADSIVVLSDGRVAEQGTLQELLDVKGIFAELWEEQKFD